VDELGVGVHSQVRILRSIADLVAAQSGSHDKGDKEEQSKRSGNDKIEHDGLLEGLLLWLA
jgi:hypothetical protein